jgi:hypothetical protein
VGLDVVRLEAEGLPVSALRLGQFAQALKHPTEFLKRRSCFGSSAAAKGSTFRATRRPSEICTAS